MPDLKSKHLAAAVLILLASLPVRATNYYFSSSAGDDSRSASEATHPGTPWKSIDKLNASMNLFTGGDSILFLRGDLFFGHIDLNIEGARDEEVVIGAYGEGALPVIQASSSVGPWTQVDGNIWVADCDEEEKVPGFIAGGHGQPMGRYPNPEAANHGYLTIQSHQGRGQITANSIQGDWAGAEAVVRTTRWILDRVGIASQQGSTLDFDGQTSMDMTNGFGFFIQDHYNTLDRQGEWFHDVAGGKLYFYTKSDPNAMVTSVNTYDYTLSLIVEENIVIQDLEFRGSRQYVVYVNHCTDITIRNIRITESGRDGIFITDCLNVEFRDSEVRDINNNAVNLANSTNLLVRDNVIKQVGMRAGMGINYSAVPMSYELVNCTFEHNVIDSIGYNAIHFGGDEIYIRYNEISRFCMVVDDGAAIYTSGQQDRIYHDRVIQGNVILVGIGAGQGTTDPEYKASEGIYMDDRTSYVDILDNTVVGTGRGIFLHNANHIVVKGNTSYNNDKQLLLVHDSNYPDFPIANCDIQDNILFAKYAYQSVVEFRTLNDDFSGFGIIDNNYYCRPVNENAPMGVWTTTEFGPRLDFTSLESWKATYGYDQNSQTSPFSIPSFHVVSDPGENRYSNSTFDDHISGWYCWANSGDCVLAWEDHQDLGGGAMSVGMDQVSEDPEAFILAMGNVGQVDKGHTYVMRFRIDAGDTDASCKIVMRRDDGSSQNLTESVYFDLSADPVQHEFQMTPNASESSARVDLVVPQSAGKVWVDDVEFFEAEVEQTKINEHIKFLVNTGESPMLFQVGGEFYDVKGEAYDDFMLDPFESRILISTNPGSGIVGNDPVKWTGRMVLYPNPAKDILRINTFSEESKQYMIISGSGKIVKQWEAAGAVDSVSISGLPAGIYYLQATGDREVFANRFVKL